MRCTLTPAVITSPPGVNIQSQPGRLLQEGLMNRLERQSARKSDRPLGFRSFSGCVWDCSMHRVRVHATVCIREPEWVMLHSTTRSSLLSVLSHPQERLWKNQWEKSLQCIRKLFPSAIGCKESLTLQHVQWSILSSHVAR